MSKRAGRPKQPQIIDAIGDYNPFQSGGGVILDHGDRHPTLVWFEPCDWDGAKKDKYGDPSECEVYHVALDKRAVLGDVETKRDVFTIDHYSNPIPYKEINTDHELMGSFGYAFGGCPYPPRQYTEWWDDSIADIAQCCGQTVDQLHEAECSEDPVQRAWFYWSVASYYGWHELTGGNVDKEMVAQLRRHWSLRMWRARKKGVRVYA